LFRIEQSLRQVMREIVVLAKQCPGVGSGSSPLGADL
jgi:hypothetical protein